MSLPKSSWNLPINDSRRKWLSGVFSILWLFGGIKEHIYVFFFLKSDQSSYLLWMMLLELHTGLLSITGHRTQRAVEQKATKIKKIKMQNCRATVNSTIPFGTLAGSVGKAIQTELFPQMCRFLGRQQLGGLPKAKSLLLLKTMCFNFRMARWRE